MRFFNFNSDPVGSDFYGPSTTFSNTSNGLTATFSSPAFPGGFAVALVPFFAPPFSGNILYDPGRQPVSNIALDIAFSSNLTSISMDFATDGTGQFLLLRLKAGCPLEAWSPLGLSELVSSIPRDRSPLAA